MDALEADTFAQNIYDIHFTVCNPPFISTSMANSLTTSGTPKYSWIDAEECTTEVIKAISSRKRIHTFPWPDALFCSLKAILPRRRFNLLNARFWPYN
jgi:short-subunit dehydrogenase